MLCVRLKILPAGMTSAAIGLQTSLPHSLSSLVVKLLSALGSQTSLPQSSCSSVVKLLSAQTMEALQLLICLQKTDYE